MMRRRLALTALLTPALCGLAAGCSRDAAAGAAPPPAPGVAAASSHQWVAAAARTLEEEVPAVGSLRARQTTRLGAEVSGEVAEVLVDVGDRVARGQPLVRLDATFFEIEGAQRRAEVQAAKARLASAEQAIHTAAAEVEHAQAAGQDAALALERMRALWEKPAGEAPSIPRSRYDAALFGQQEAAARLRSAESRVAEAQARVAEAAVGVELAAEAQRFSAQRLRKAVVVAPYDGVVTARLVDPGEPVTAAPVTHLVEVQETSALYLEFALPQELLTSVREGTPVRFAAEGVVDGAERGEVALVFPTIDPATRSFRCRVVVDGASGRHRPGMLVRVQVTTRQLEEAVVVPRAALAAADGGWSVRVRGPDDQPRVRPVALGLVTATAAQVLEGLAPGEQVLVPERR